MISKKKERKKRSFLFNKRFNKRGQVRGIDFALAMLIFIIAFSQVVIVIFHLLVPSIMQMDTYNNNQEIDKITNLVFNSPGSPNNWATIGTPNLNDFVMGLNEANKELSFSKINRLTPDLIDYWRLDYVSVKVSYGLFKDFAIGIDSPIVLNISSYSIGFGKIVIEGEIYDRASVSPIPNVEVTSFAIDTNNSVSVNVTKTQYKNGTYKFKASLSVADSDYYSIAVFAKLSDIYETYKIFRVHRPSESLDYEVVNFDFRPFAFSNSETKSSSLDVHSPRPTVSSSAEAIVLFSDYDFDKAYYKTTLTATSSADEGNIYLGEKVPLPSEGLAIVLVQETDGSNYRAGYIGIPMILNMNDNSLFGASNILTEGSYIHSTNLYYVRNRLMMCQMWLK